MENLASGKISLGEKVIFGRVAESGPYFLAFLTLNGEEEEIYRGYKLAEALESVNKIFRKRLREGYRASDPEANPFLFLKTDSWP